MYKHTEKNHCISCQFFNEHMYDETFMDHQCLWDDEEEVPAEQLLFCPECEGKIITDEDSDEDYCPCCGLVVRGPYKYTSGQLIDFPYGLRI